jgi:hypothetical protein
LRSRYIVDQINHPYVTDEVLLSPLMYRCIILIREPQATLRSMMKLFQCHESEALTLYVERLEALSHYGLLLKKRAHLVQYDDLVDHTNQTLAGLSKFIGLESPFRSTYAAHRMTGSAGFGDSSPHINSGHVIRTPANAMPIGEDSLIVATRAFVKCREQLEQVTFQVTGYPEMTTASAPRQASEGATHN